MSAAKTVSQILPPESMIKISFAPSPISESFLPQSEVCVRRAATRISSSKYFLILSLYADIKRSVFTAAFSSGDRLFDLPDNVIHREPEREPQKRVWQADLPHKVKRHARVIPDVQIKINVKDHAENEFCQRDQNRRSE